MGVGVGVGVGAGVSLTVGAVSEVGFRRMFAILHDNMRNARDANQAVNRSLSNFSLMFSSSN